MRKVDLDSGGSVSILVEVYELIYGFCEKSDFSGFRKFSKFWWFFRKTDLDSGVLVSILGEVYKLWFGFCEKLKFFEKLIFFNFWKKILVQEHFWLKIFNRALQNMISKGRNFFEKISGTLTADGILLRKKYKEKNFCTR